MTQNLIAAIYDNSLDIDALSDAQQQQLIADFQMLAEHWAASTQSGYSDLGKQILLVIEQAGPELAKTGEILH